MALHAVLLKGCGRVGSGLIGAANGSADHQTDQGASTEKERNSTAARTRRLISRRQTSHTMGVFYPILGVRLEWNPRIAEKWSK